MCFRRICGRLECSRTWGKLDKEICFKTRGLSLDKEICSRLTLLIYLPFDLNENCYNSGSERKISGENVGFSLGVATIYFDSGWLPKGKRGF